VSLLSKHNRPEGHSIWYTHGRVSSDYTTVGHVTVDVMADGSRRPGGGAFYSALQAARLGWRARIVTRGARAEIEALLAPYAAELEIEIAEAEHTTTLGTSTSGGERSQRMLAWAGEMDSLTPLEATIVHFAPVAHETGARWRGHARFVGVTPQGLLRTWSRIGVRIRAQALDPALLPQRCDAIVISSAERDSCAPLLKAPGDGIGDPLTPAPVIAVTDSAGPTELYLPGGRTTRVPVAEITRPRDDLGAGDVFAAAFFVALAEGSPPQRAAVFANAAAAVRICGEGAAAIGDRAAITARVAAFN
jgi:sugar/nucleoside kinase (ribokinase family)